MCMFSTAGIDVQCEDLDSRLAPETENNVLQM